MNNDLYLIPANSKRSMLILGLFRKIDMIIFGTGFGVSLILVMAVPMTDMLVTILALLPGLVTGFLVLPVPNYHNVLSILISAYKFFTKDQGYIWKGWCFTNEEKNNK